MPENVTFFVSRAGAILALVLVVVSWGGPALAESEKAAELWGSIAHPFAKLQDRISDMLGGLRTVAFVSTDYYGEIIRSDWHYFQYPRYYNRVRTYFATDYLPSKINQSAYELITDNLDWIYISYYKSPLIFEKICRTLGQSNFLLGLSTFFEQYKYEIALLSDLQEVFEDIVNFSLDWLFFPWFDNDYLPNYWITTCDFDDVQYELTVVIEDQNEVANDYTYSQQVPLYVYDSEDSVIYNDVIWINSTTTLTIPLGFVPEKVRLVYGQDVIVQLWDPAITYIDALVGEDVAIIFGYDVNILLIFCVLPLIYVIYKFSKKKKSNSKI